MTKTAIDQVRPDGGRDTSSKGRTGRFGARWPSALVAGLVALCIPAPALAADSLATPITVQSVDELWPLEIEVAIVPLDSAEAAGPSGAAEPEPMPSITRKVVVPDGLKVVLSEGLHTPQGKRQFEVEVVARHHPGHAVEIEWDLRVDEAQYRPVSWDKYLLHRLQLAEEAKLGDALLKIARSDIVSTQGEPYRKRVSIGEDTYEIRITARSLRG